MSVHHEVCVCVCGDVSMCMRDVTKYSTGPLLNVPVTCSAEQGHLKFSGTFHHVAVTVRDNQPCFIHHGDGSEVPIVVLWAASHLLSIISAPQAM